MNSIPFLNLEADQIAGFVLVMARVGVLFAVAPVFSSRMMPPRAKLIAAAAISLALTPLAPHVLAAVFVIALEVAAPPLIALVVADAAFGLVARAVPQMNVFIVGLPAKILLGLATIATSLPFMAGHITDGIDRAVGDA